MILMFGDVHGSFKHVLPVVNKHKPAAIIFLGDLEAERPLEQELAEVMKLTDIYFIHGNHDSIKRSNYDNLFNSALADRNLHGRVVEIDGFKVAGLGGIFREKIWWPDTKSSPVHDNYEGLVKHLNSGLAYHEMSEAAAKQELIKHRGSIFYEDWLNMHDLKADILVTHEAPSCHRRGFKAIDSLAQAMKAKSTFHGHHHDRQNYQAHEERLGFRAHGVGYRGVSDLYGNMIVAGAQDAHKDELNRSKT